MDYKAIINELVQKIDVVLKKYDIDPEMFLISDGIDHKADEAEEKGLNVVRNDENHRGAHEEIMQIIASYIDVINEDKESFLGIVRDNLMSVGNFRGQNLIIRAYVRDFLGCLFSVKDGVAQVNESENFKLPHIVKRYDFDEINENYQYLDGKMGNLATNPKRQVNLFILPNGDTYSCLLGHAVLAWWLCVNGISLKKAIRVEFTKENYSVDLSTLGNGGFSIESNNDFNLEWTDEQAQIFASLHNTLSERWKFLKPLEENLRMSSGFGFDKTVFNEKLAKVNLFKIEDFIPDFNKNKYLRELASLYKVTRFNPEEWDGE